MGCIQLIVKNADTENLNGWTLSIYKPDKEEESPDFNFLFSEEEDGDVFLDFCCEDFEKVIPYILEFSKSSYVQIVIGKYSYSMNEEEVKILKEIVEDMLPCQDLEDAELGIALYSESMGQKLSITGFQRKVEIITV